MWTLVVLCFWAQALLHTTVHGLRIQGSSLVDSNGQNVQLYGFNSFGMNNQRTYFGRPGESHQTPTDVRPTEVLPLLLDCMALFLPRMVLTNYAMPVYRNHVGWNVVKQSPLGRLCHGT